MKKGLKNSIVLVLFFSALWGLAEAVFGRFLYSHSIPHPSVYLTIIGFSVLTIARVHLPFRGTATAIAALAMLYKFLNIPFFACHFLGILLLGICYDIFFNVLKIKNQSVSAALAVYAGYGSFALAITYVFRYSYWIEAGLSKVINHIAIGGTLAALGCAVAVPLSFRFAQWLQTKKAWSAELSTAFTQLRVAFVTAGMWVFALVAFIMH